MKRTDAPPIPPLVVEWLDSLFPAQVPTEVQTHAEYCALTGQRQVIERMKKELRRQEQNVID